ncbi:Uncharacterised protein [Shigella sonnei]|nr:Uncharacterised protein [Shigella sonnei]
MTVLRHGLRVDNFLLLTLTKADSPLLRESGHLPQTVGHITPVSIGAGKTHPVSLAEGQFTMGEEGNILSNVLLR